jgi:hypothetical protein
MPRKSHGAKILNEINVVNKSAVLFGADIYAFLHVLCGI